MLAVASLLLSGLGVGGLIGAYAKSLLDQRQLRFSKVFDFKEVRYKAIMILMWVAMHPDDHEFAMLKQHRPQIVGVAELDRELQLEYHNAMLYASDDVLEGLSIFMEQKDIAAWKAVTRAMRDDLYF
jgi:hypothetical protein